VLRILIQKPYFPVPSGAVVVDCLMKSKLRYVVFRTRWGWFGLAASQAGLIRTCLPVEQADTARRHLLRDLADAQRDEQLEKELQERIKAYFEGEETDFSGDITVVLGAFSAFDRQVLAACRQIGYGRRISYGQLAERSDRPRAARAVGRALAKNPLPLIIPCHRVVRGDGKIGGFSATGGAAFKEKILRMEATASKTGDRRQETGDRYWILDARDS